MENINKKVVSGVMNFKCVCSVFVLCSVVFCCVVLCLSAAQYEHKAFL